MFANSLQVSRKRFAWHLHRVLRSFALLGGIGLGALAFAVAFYFFVVRPLDVLVVTLRGKSADTQAHARGVSAMSPRQLPIRQLELFYESFPKMKEIPSVLARLHEAAMMQGVILEEGEYRMVRADSDKLVRYEMSLPIKGDYVHLRKFLSKTLSDMHYISLDSVDFQRQKISDPVLEAQVKITLFLVED
jgi:Tfp pilus assembly protein PilO